MDLKDIDKATLMDVVLKELTRAVDKMTERARATAASAVHEESRAEDSKDTRAIEESYLAAGQAARAGELDLDRATLRALDLKPFTEGRAIAAGALVEVEDEQGESRTLLIVPRGGGRNVHFGGREITLATPASPLGGALMGATEGDEVEVLIKARARPYEIVGVA